MTDNREPERTTVVHTEKRGSGGAIALVVLILLVLLILFMFRDEIFGAAEQADDQVDVEITTTNAA